MLLSCLLLAKLLDHAVALLFRKAATLVLFCQHLFFLTGNLLLLLQEAGNLLLVRLLAKCADAVNPEAFLRMTVVEEHLAHAVRQVVAPLAVILAAVSEEDMPADQTALLIVAL